MKAKGLFIILILILTVLSGCTKSVETTEVTEAVNGEETTAAAATEKEPVTLTMLMHDALMYEYFTETNSISEAYKKVAPHVTIEVEKAKDSGQMEETLKIRYSANELPDLMLIKPYMLADFKDGLADLSDTQASKTNQFAASYAVEGKVVGIPETAFYEFVYYNKSIFTELGLEIPTTWDQFIEASLKIKESGKYIPIAMGAKDSWPVYPFNEFMPSLEAAKGDYWNIMTTQETPFSAGEPFYESYLKIKKLYEADVFGNDPLGIGWDQSKALFIAKEAAMIAAGQWFISDYVASGADIADLGMFLLPARNTESDPFYATVMADGFMSTPADGENLDEVKAFIDWYFASEYYPAYLAVKGLGSTVEGMKVDLPYASQMEEAFSRQEVSYILYDGGNIDFSNISNAIGFDVKKMGQEMLAGENFDEMMSDLNEQWKKAKNELKP